jgi:hypothetical protein
MLIAARGGGISFTVFPGVSISRLRLPEIGRVAVTLVQQTSRGLRAVWLSPDLGGSCGAIFNGVGKAQRQGDDHLRRVGLS